MKIALCQLAVSADKAANLKNARTAVDDAASQGAELVVLPECFNSPYDTKCFPEYAEAIPSPTVLPSVAITETPTKPGSEEVSATEHPSTHMLCEAARKNKIYLIGGSIPEREGSCVYNTCVVVGPDGKIILKHRKVHLFDIDVPGKITFRESDTLTGGSDVSVFATPHGNVGVAICYDMRFPELAMIMRHQYDAKLIVYPGAFNMTTGPKHWELLQRARAVDNQVFVAAASPARDMSASYNAWGHSTVISPWGEVVATTDHSPSTVVADVHLDDCDEIRKSIPVSMQRRTDLYTCAEWIKRGGRKASSKAVLPKVPVAFAAGVALGAAAFAFFRGEKK